MRFVGRKNELEYINKIIRSNKPELLIMYGRRRLGKTTLLKQTLKDSLYYLCVEESMQKNIDYLKSALAERLGNDLIKAITADSFSELFRLIKDMIPKDYTIAIDEFPYLINQDKSIVSQFQKAYDEYFKPKSIKLILCGSSISMMTDLMGYQSPLYGRRTGAIRLGGFSIKETREFLGEMPLKTIFDYHLLFGGIPYYLEQIDTDLSFDDNIRNFFFSGQSIFLDEVSFLLKEEFREIRNYYSILRSIAKGKSRFTEISSDTLIEKSSLSKYLVTLSELGIIQNMRSFFDKQNSKRTIYIIIDNYIYVWFSVLSRHLNNLENAQVQKSILQDELPQTFGHLFEQLCMKMLSKRYEKVGSYFREVEIDILGQNKKKITCFECKYRMGVDEAKIITDVKKKIEFLPKDYTYDAALLSIDKGITLDKLYELS